MEDAAGDTRRADCLDAARLILVSAMDGHPDVATFHCNLACDECQLGNLKEAKTRLKGGFQLDPEHRVKAPDDEDLEVLWDSLSG